MRALGAFLCVAATAACGTGGGRGTPPIPGPHGFPSAPPVQTCAPEAGGPFWLQEKETLSFQVVCATGVPLPAGAAVQPMPDGATFDASTGTFRWTPGLDQAAVYELLLQTPGETGSVKVGVADAWDDPANVPPVDPARYGEEYGLPVLFLTPSRGLEHNSYTPTSVTYGGHRYDAESKIKGVTSLSYPKKSFTVKFDKTDHFGDPARGFTDKHRIALVGNFDDNSYLRYRLAFDLWDRMDAAHVQLQAYDVVVYYGGKFLGLYTLTDHIDGDLMKSQGLDEHGDLYKAETHDCDFRLVTGTDAQPKSPLHLGYQQTEGYDGWGALDDLIGFVGGATNADLRDHLAEKIDVQDYEDWWIFVTFILASDSAGKNSFHYHSATSGGGVFHYVPWDFNASFGQDWQTVRSYSKDGIDFTGDNNLFARLLSDPAFRTPMKARYGTLLRGPWKQEDLDALVDAHAAEIAPVADRDWRKWQGEYRSYYATTGRTDWTTPAQEIAYLKHWLDTRWSWEAQRYPAP